LLCKDEQTQVCGIVVVENYSGFGLVHARHFDQKAAKLFTSLMQVPILVFEEKFGNDRIYSSLQLCVTKFPIASSVCS